VPLLGQGVGLGDPQRALPSPAMLEFGDAVNGSCVMLSLTATRRIRHPWVIESRSCFIFLFFSQRNHRLASQKCSLDVCNSQLLEGFCFLLLYLLFTATLGAVFGVTTCLSAQIREEPRDPLNYFIGGCATGAVLGARGKCGSCPRRSGPSLLLETFLLGKSVKEAWCQACLVKIRLSMCIPFHAGFRWCSIVQAC